ncbi:hypothetical protein HPSH465_1196 [Glaesserella parasuis H465]|nr:hypothetical protein HPSH465_1196 [Glaesserella parasuis H465]
MIVMFSIQNNKQTSYSEVITRLLIFMTKRQVRENHFSTRVTKILQKSMQISPLVVNFRLTNLRGK